MSSEPLNNSDVESTTKREGKIFVGGLTWDTSVDDVKTYFRQYGSVVDASIIKDPSTGRSRGFGFVVFEDEATVKKVFDAGSHFINGKKVDAKNAFRRNSEPTCRKIFVGGVDPLLPESEIREYFSKFGQIEEIDFPWDKEKNQRRAFCFVAFVSPEVVDEILKQPKHKLGDRMVDVKKATPKQDTHLGANNSNFAWNLISQALNLNNYNSGALLASLLSNPNSSLGSSLSALGLGSLLPGVGGTGGGGMNAAPNLSAAALQAALSAAQNNGSGGRLPSSAAALAAAAAAAAMASQSSNGQSPSLGLSGSNDDIRLPGTGGLGGGTGGSNGNPVADALSGLSYGASSGGPGNLSSHLSSLLGGQNNSNVTQNPYFALAAAAAAAGLYPPASPSVDLTSWYSNLAMAAAAAANQDGHGHNPAAMHHPSSHRDIAPSSHYHGHGSAGSHAHMPGGGHGSGGGYGKASRSGLSPNPGGGSGGGHRSATAFHPYSR